MKECKEFKEVNAMKVYISGKITGLPIEEAKAKFERAEWLLDDIGLQPVNPLKNGLSLHDSWEKHIVRDIELLLECDGILMLTTWMGSKGANIAYFIAKKKGMEILFESNIAREHDFVEKVQNAIHEATGMTFEYYSTKRRFRDGFFARVIFAYHCHKNSIYNPIRYFGRDRTLIYHYLNTYEWELRHNPKFRKMARRVEEILNGV
jgi:hypothetical protein